MQTIYITQDFAHRGVRFYKGETRKVSAQDAGLFSGLGWAQIDGEPAKEPKPEAVTLKVEGAAHTQKADTPA